MTVMTIFKDYLSDMAFAMSGKPSARRKQYIHNEVKDADIDRAKGIMSSLSRGSALLQQEEIGERVKISEKCQ